MVEWADKPDSSWWTEVAERWRLGSPSGGWGPSWGFLGAQREYRRPRPQGSRTPSEALTDARGQVGATLRAVAFRWRIGGVLVAVAHPRECTFGGASVAAAATEEGRRGTCGTKLASALRLLGRWYVRQCPRGENLGLILGPVRQAVSVVPGRREETRCDQDALQWGRFRRRGQRAA
jgi:hypothetical protein